MKKIIIIITILCLQFTQAQLSVGSKNIGKKQKDLAPIVLESIASATTIFVLPNVYSKEDYHKVIKESWTLTPYEIVNIENYNPSEYIEGNYFIFMVTGYIKTIQGNKTITGEYADVHHVRTHLDMFRYNASEFDKSFKYYLEKGYTKKQAYDTALSKSYRQMARVLLYPNSNFANRAVNTVSRNRKDDSDYDSNYSLFDDIYSNDVFYNYSLGTLKNYLQTIDLLYKTKQKKSLFEENISSQLKKLKKLPLYIPEYAITHYDPRKSIMQEFDQEYVKEKFNNYSYSYKVIAAEQLNEKILNNEEFYYLRYTLYSVESFIEVVNGKTGEIVYSDYQRGKMFTTKSFNIQKSQLKKLSKSIDKAS